MKSNERKTVHLHMMLKRKLPTKKGTEYKFCMHCNLVRVRASSPDGKEQYVTAIPGTAANG